MIHIYVQHKNYIKNIQINYFCQSYSNTIMHAHKIKRVIAVKLHRQNALHENLHLLKSCNLTRISLQFARLLISFVNKLYNRYLLKFLYCTLLKSLIEA
jgi:hypothetical protein